MGAAEEPAIALHPVPDDRAAPVLAARRHPMDRALQAVEHVLRASRVHLEAHLVVVAADLAPSYDTAPSAPIPLVLPTLIRWAAPRKPEAPRNERSQGGRWRCGWGW